MPFIHDLKLEHIGADELLLWFISIDILEPTAEHHLVLLSRFTGPDEVFELFLILATVRTCREENVDYVESVGLRSPA